MTMRIPIYKMVAAGNDFVVLDVREGQPAADFASRAGELAKRLCRRRFDVGADGLMLLGDPHTPSQSFSMRYYNSDGSHGSACGNGARALAWLAATLGLWTGETEFQTDAGLYHARIEGHERLSIGMSEGAVIATGIGTQEKRPFKVDFFNTGVPHVVTWLQTPSELDAYPVQSVGRMLRYDESFGPAGTNANFAAVADLHATVPLINIRTYERGVEEETLACGTGCMATAASFVLRSRRSEGMVDLRTASGDVLRATLRIDGDRLTEMRLQGPARLVFEGSIALGA